MTEASAPTQAVANDLFRTLWLRGPPGSGMSTWLTLGFRAWAPEAVK